MTKTATAPAAEHFRELLDKMVDRAKERGCFYGSERAEQAFRKVPRHLFLPGQPLDRVYSGDVIPTRFDEQKNAISSSSEVCVMACMAEQLDLASGMRVLEIGAGVGYNAAILAELVGEEGAVTTIDIDQTITSDARAHLDAARYARVRTLTGDGWLGVPDGAPYDRIEATASVADLSPLWVDQLMEGGILLVPLHLLGSLQALVAFRKSGRSLRSVSLRPGGFMDLRGPHGVTRDEPIQLDGWDVQPGTKAANELDLLRELLALHPQHEVVGALSFDQAFPRLPVVDPDIVIAKRRDFGGWSSGLLDRDGRSLAFVEFVGSPLGARVILLTWFGGEAAANRLRSFLAGRSGHGIADLEIEALPAASAGDLVGDAILKRANYHFAIRRREPKG